MGLETGTTIAELNPLWPLGSDPKSQGDDHLRLIKSVVQNDAVVRGDIGAVEIVEADASAGWQVWGDTLIQWGKGTIVNTAIATVFPQPFQTGTVPGVIAVSGSNAAGGQANYTITVTEASISNTLFQTTARQGTSNALNVDFIWIAVGEAPDALKKAKSVQAFNVDPGGDPGGAAGGGVGASGTFTAKSGEAITVSDGVITEIG